MAHSVQTYSVTIDGYGPIRYVARSAGKARWRAYRDSCLMYDCTFRRFLEITTCHAVGNEHPVGTRILVEGVPALHCGFRGQYVLAMREEDDAPTNWHRSDVRMAV